MNRLLQRFVGDASSSQRSTGEADWAATRANETQQPANPSYYHHQQQHYAQQHTVANSHGLEEIPLSSPVGGTAGAFFDSQNAHFGRPQQQQQSQLKQRQEAAADAFFQSEGLSPPSRPRSADVFAQPPRSGASSHSGAVRSFFESSSASDPFVSAPTSSRSGFDVHQQQQQQQPALSTTGSVSDLFASPPRSTTPSFDGFEQQQHRHYNHQQHENSSLSASSSSADLFANPPQAQAASSFFYDGFEQQQTQQSDNGWATADELFASAGPSPSSSFHSSGFGGEQQSPFASAPGSYHGSVGAEQQTREISASATPTAAATTTTPNGDNSAANPFANAPRSTTNSFGNSGFDQQHFHNDLASTPADPFATNSTEALPTANTTFEQQQQQHDYYTYHQQQQYDYQQESYQQQHQHQQYDYQYQNAQQQEYDYQKHQYDHQHQQYNHDHHQQHHDQQHHDQHQHQHQQYDHQYYYDNQQTAASLFESTAPPTDDQANPFAGPSESNGYPADDAHADPFAQQAHSHSGYGDSRDSHDAPAANATAVANGVYATPSPTQVNDFFSSEAPPTPSASSLFDSQPSDRSFDGTSKPPTPVRQPSPLKAAQTSSLGGFSSAESHCESFSEPLAVSTTPTSSRNNNQMSIKELNPVGDDDDDTVDEGVEAVARSLKQTTLDDSVKLVEMYKQMTERLEGEKNELLKVLADQADQFYQMQEYIASLEHELAALRSQRK